MTTAPLTPDLAEHPWRPLASARRRDGFVDVEWPDGTAFAAWSPWLAEGADGYGLDPVVRESTLDPRSLPAPGDLLDARVDDDGALALTWPGRPPVRVHPGWLRHVADGGHLPASALDDPVPWTAADLGEPPTVDGADVLHDDEVLEAWLAGLVRHGLCRLTGVGTDPDLLTALMARVGPIRDTNFGAVWSVRVVPDPDSTANTGIELGQHTDLPTREVPPGFQLLHCVESSVAGGRSRMTDGLALVDVLRREHPEALDALTTLEWVFANRSPDADHRWVGPIVELPAGGRPLTMRAFYPVRLAPCMDPADVPRAYEALRVFAEVASDPRLELRTALRPGDLVAFDNRRVLHGRDAFEPTGARHLRGCYADRDDVLSRLRVLRRAHRKVHP